VHGPISDFTVLDYFHFCVWQEHSNSVYRGKSWWQLPVYVRRGNLLLGVS